MFEVSTIKLLAMDATGLAKDALHVHVGLLLFIAVRIMWRGRGGGVAAWLLVLAATLGGEWIDLRSERMAGVTVATGEHFKDVWNTMLWPTLLLILWRWLPGSRQPSVEVVSGEHGERVGE